MYLVVENHFQIMSRCRDNFGSRDSSLSSPNECIGLYFLGPRIENTTQVLGSDIRDNVKQTSVLPLVCTKNQLFSSQEVISQAEKLHTCGNDKPNLFQLVWFF